MLTLEIFLWFFLASKKYSGLECHYRTYESDVFWGSMMIQFRKLKVKDLVFFLVVCISISLFMGHGNEPCCMGPFDIEYGALQVNNETGNALRMTYAGLESGASGLLMGINMGLPP